MNKRNKNSNLDDVNTSPGLESSLNVGGMIGLYIERSPPNPKEAKAHLGRPALHFPFTSFNLLGAPAAKTRSDGRSSITQSEKNKRHCSKIYSTIH